MDGLGSALITYLCLGDHEGGRGTQPVSDEELAVAIGHELQHHDLLELAEDDYQALVAELAAWLTTSCRPDLAPRVATVPLAVVLTHFGEQMINYSETLDRPLGRVTYSRHTVLAFRDRGMALLGDVRPIRRHVRAPRSRRTGTTRRTRATSRAPSPARQDDPEPPLAQPERAA